VILTLIRPHIGQRETGAYVVRGRMEPLQLGVIAALTPPEVDIEMYDDRMEAIPYDRPADLVGITVETFTARRAYQISSRYRARGVKVVLGGLHPTLAPGEAGLHADAIVLGDAEGAWPALLADFRGGRLRRRYRGPPDARPQSGMPVRRDIFRGKGYLPLPLVQFGRGCRYSCAFCACSAFFSATYRHRDVGEVVREIEEIGSRNILFSDDNIAAEPAAAEELFRALRALRIRWGAQASIDIARDPRLLRLAAESGCVGFTIGFESIDPAALRDMHKAHNLSASPGYATELENLRDAGLLVWGTFTIGHDHDPPEAARRCVEFAVQNRFFYASFNLLTPYPGTPLYRRLRAQGRLLFGGTWWLDADYRLNGAAHRPALMSPEELTECCDRAEHDFHSIRSILSRAFDFRTNARSPFRLGMLLAYNLLFRSEGRRRSRLMLGMKEELAPG
jgi:radical SAM superfamily enzyme YgiQ (UPF0313 family)